MRGSWADREEARKQRSDEARRTRLVRIEEFLKERE
jgi:hypothetical protein